MSATFDYSGQEVLVTGGSNGIGRAIATAFGAAGAEVTITGTRASAADYDADLSGFAYRRLALEDDASVDATVAAFDRLDVLVNNAGNAVRPPEAWTPAGFDLNVKTLLGSVFRISQGFAPKMAARPGAIVNIASMYSYFGSPKAPGYGAAKAGVVQLTRSLGALHAEAGIRVNAIAPGWIRTNLSVNAQANPEMNAMIEGRTPMGRWGEPEELAGAALFLASNELAGFVNGVTIAVDGGYQGG